MKKYYPIFFTFLSVNAVAYVHTVNKSETLSELCQRLVPGRVYGNGGSLKKVLSLNPKIRNKHRVFPGQKIAFPGQEPSQETAKLEPTKSIASSEAPVFSSFSRLYALVGSEYFQIKSQDKASKGKADFASNNSPRLDLIWELQWSPEYKSRIFFSRVMESIMDDSASGKELKRAKGNRDSFGLEVVKQVSKDSHVGVYGARSTRSFARAVSPTLLTFDRVNGFEVGVKAEKTLAQINKATLNAHAKVGWLAPTEASSYKVNSGKTGLVGLTLRHELRAVTLEAQTYYGYWQQDSKYSKQSSTQVGMGIGASWRFDE